MKVKICGITRHEDARLALELGAWALGFVFHPPSPRRVLPEAVAEIIERLPPGTISVGVFVDAPLAEVQRTVERTGLKAVQLHGGETPAYAAAVRAERVIKAFRVKGGFDVREIDAYPGCLVLLDTYVEGSPGGTGRSCDLRIAREAQGRAPIILAGGLTPENVEEVIRAVGPEGIDVSSGVEARPGEKDPAKLRRLFEAVARASSKPPAASRQPPADPLSRTSEIE